MKKRSIIARSYKALLLCLVCFSIMTCCREEEECCDNEYNWYLPGNPSLNNLYYDDGYYYIIEVDRDRAIYTYRKISEKCGKLLFSTDFDSNIDLTDHRQLYEKDGEIIFLVGRKLHRFSKSTGALITTDTLTTYPFRSHRNLSMHTGAGYVKDTGFEDYAFFEVKKANNKYYQDRIHLESVENYNDTACIGLAPIKHGTKWIMPFSKIARKSSSTNNYFIVKEGDKIDRIPFIPNNEGKNVTEQAEDQNNLYIKCVGVIYAYDKNTLQKLWDVKPNGISLSTMELIGDYIYYGVDEGEGKMYKINKHTGDTKVIDVNVSGINDPILLENSLFFIPRTSRMLYKYNLLTDKIDWAFSSQEAPDDYLYNFGVSPKTKVLYDNYNKRWECTQWAGE